MRRFERSTKQIAIFYGRWIRHRDRSPRFQPRIASSDSISEDALTACSRPSLESIRKRLSLNMKPQDFSSQESENTLQKSKLEGEMALRSPDLFYDLDKFEKSAAAQARIMHEKMFNDSEEVVRKKNKQDILKYMQLAFRGTRAAASLTKIAHLLEKVSQKCNEINREIDGLEPDDASVWTYVLDSLSEKELKQLWSCGFVDAEIIQCIASPSFAGETVENKFNITKSPDNLLSFFFDESDAFFMSTKLTERLAQFRKLYCLSTLTHGLCEGIDGLPHFDLSPVLEKAMKKNFSDISKTDLSALEKYEESKSVKLQAKRNSNIHQLSISEAILHRALLPSNQFLSAVSQYDPALKKSLDILERVKRHTLLDPIFQEAVAISKEMERKAEYEGAGSVNKVKERRKMGGFKGSKDPFARESVLTDMPLFYSSKHNVVPPHGRYSLPSPRLPRETQKILQRRRKKEHIPFKK